MIITGAAGRAISGIISLGRMMSAARRPSPRPDEPPREPPRHHDADQLDSRTALHPEKGQDLFTIQVVEPETLMAAGRSAGAEYALDPDSLLLLVGDGSGRLISLGAGGKVYALTESGASMLIGALTRGVEWVVRKTAIENDVEQEMVRRDLLVFLRGLQKQGAMRRSTARRLLRDLQAAVLELLAAVPLSIGGKAIPRLDVRCRLLLGLAYVSIRLIGWRQSVGVWRRWSQRSAGPADAATSARRAREIDEVLFTAATDHVLPITCKEHALVLWAVLRGAGLPALLVVGIALFPFAAHCWCDLGDETFGDDRGQCRHYQPVARYA